MKTKMKKLRIGSIIVVLIGFLLWIVIGPVIASTATVTNSGGHKWSFFHWYCGLSGTEPIAEEVTAMYWVGILISIIGFFVFAVGLIGATLTFLLRNVEKG